MKFKLLVLLLVAITISLNAQRLLKITVTVDGTTKHLPYLVRKGTAYASAKGLAAVLSGNHFYNPEAQKVELKYKNYNLKFTAKNQFVILISKTNNTSRIFQLPISTLLIKNDVFIPLNYSLEYLNLAYEKEIRFNNANKHLSVTNIPVNTVAEIRKYKDESTAIGPKPVRRNDSKYDIYALDIEEKSNGTLLRLYSQKKINKQSSFIRGGKLYLSLSGVTVNPELKNTIPRGLIKKIETKSVGKNIQIELALKDGYSTHETFQDVDTEDLLITIHNKFLSGAAREFEEEIDKWKFDVVVIDAGHGGKDAGAIGVTGIREKNVNLGIALKLGKLIEKNLKDVKVVYTRKTDKFVELYKRGKIANEKGGKLFISIHCNSARKKPSDARGFEVYLLRPGRTKEAIAIAEFENNVIQYEDNPDRYQKLTDENFILVSMAHSSYMRYSEKFSDLLNQRWEHDVKLPTRGVKQAGFYVLVGASMPGVLVESGFLSNRKDEAFLKSSKGQSEIASAIFNGIKSFKDYYNKMIEEEI